MRTGKLLGKTKVLIPYYDTEGARQYTMITIEGDIYASKLYAGIKEFARANFGVEVNKDWLHHVPLIVNEHDPEVKISEEEKNQLIEEFIQRMELKDDDETESGSVTGSETEDVAQAGQPLCAMPDQPEQG